MQGAALKLTALAASLAVGFVVLVQTQQSLTPRNPGDLSAFEEAPGFENEGEVCPDGEGELASTDDPLANAPQLGQAEPGMPTGAPEPVESSMTDLRPVPEDDNFAAVPVPSRNAEQNAFRRDSGEGKAAGLPAQPAENDPFAAFARQATDQFAREISEQSEPVVAAAAEAVEQVDAGVNMAAAEMRAGGDKIQQTAHEVAGQLPRDLQQVPQEGFPVLQAVADEIEERSGVSFPGLNPETEAAAGRPPQTKEMRLELAQRFPTDNDSDPFAMTPPKSAAKPKPKAEETKEEQPKTDAAPAGFPLAEPQPLPAKTENEKPAPAEPAKMPFGFPQAEPAPLEAAPLKPADSRPSGFPQFNVESEPAAGLEATPEEMPAVGNDAAENKVVENGAADSKAEENKAAKPPGAFFGEFSGEENGGNADDPYRLVPEFNGKPEENASREPAPFQFQPETEAPVADTQAGSAEEAMTATPDSAAPSVPATPNPFGFTPEPSTTSTATPEEPGGFPALGGPVESAPEGADEPQPEMEPAPAGNLPPAQPGFEAFSTNESAPLSVPMADDQNPPAAEPRPAPGGFPGFPGAPEMTQEETPAEAPAEEPAPLANTEEKPVAEPKETPLNEDELLGSAYVDGDQIESVQQPKVELYKSAPENAVLGEPLIYSIEVVNTGEVAVRDVRVEDQFPAGTKLTGTIPRAELVEKTLLWNFEELKPEERKKILVRVVPIEPGTIGSISTVSYKSVVAAQTVVTAPRLELSLSTSQQEIAVGESVEVKFVVANTGEGAAHNVILRNLIPSGLEHPAGADLEYEIGTLNGGEQKEIALAMLAKEAGDFTNEASLKSKGGVSAAGEATIRIIPSVMSLTQNGPTRRFVGHAADYDATVKNNSQRMLTGLTVTQVVPEGMEFRSASSGGTFDAVRRTVTWQLGNLPSGETASLQTKLVPRKTGVQALQLQAREAGGSFAELDLSVKVEGMASLAVRVPEERGPVSKGERVSLKFKVVNRGSAPADNVLVNCRVPAQLKFLSAEGAAQPQSTPNGVSFAPAGSLAANQEMVFTLVFTAESAGDARVEFEVTAGGLATPLKHQEQVIVYGD